MSPYQKSLSASTVSRFCGLFSYKRTETFFFLVVNVAQTSALEMLPALAQVSGGDLRQAAQRVMWSGFCQTEKPAEKAAGTVALEER